MSESILKKFGKYFLLDRIGEGGMAEIFRARLASLDSSGRLLVIKRIQAAFGNNAEFAQMFRSEVQVTMRFAHPNIVQLYEAGEEDGQQYIAMELVDGRNIRQVLTKLGHKKERTPVPAAAFIIEQTAAGLHYAHTFKDRITGVALNLVHRDVSPQNIIVSYDGNIKVIDFGIAKATTNGEATRAGVIKGKLSYLSPEQVMGEVLDARSDIFALGIVLWELLTGKRLFVAEGENEFQVLKMIESCSTFVKPPSAYNPEVPKELDAIVMQALTRDTKKRFQTAEEMARALRKLLAVQYSDFGPSDLSTFVKTLFQDHIIQDRKQLQTVNAQAEELIALGVQKTTQENSVTTEVERPGHADKKDHTRVTPLGDKFDRSQMTSADRLEVAGQPQRQMKVPANAALNTHSNTFSKNHNNTSTFSGKRPVPVAHPTPVQRPEESSGGGLFKTALILAVLGGGGYFAYDHFLQPGQRALTASSDHSNGVKPVLSNAKQVSLKLHLFPADEISKTRVTVNSQIYDLNQGAMDVPVGEPLEVIVERPGFITFRKEFTLRSEELQAAKEWGLDVKLDPMIYGTLSISTRPAVADVRIINMDQGSRGVAQAPLALKTPVYQERLPSGHYKVVVQNELLNVEKSFQVEIHEGREAVFSDVQLETKH